jgi:hypothetical protein
VNCPACQHENRAGAKFCEECAAPLKRVCASCGAELRPTAKFCDECGTPLQGVKGLQLAQTASMVCCALRVSVGSMAHLSTIAADCCAVGATAPETTAAPLCGTAPARCKISAANAPSIGKWPMDSRPAEIDRSLVAVPIPRSSPHAGPPFGGTTTHVENIRARTTRFIHFYPMCWHITVCPMSRHVRLIYNFPALLIVPTRRPWRRFRTARFRQGVHPESTPVRGRTVRARRRARGPSRQRPPTGLRRLKPRLPRRRLHGLFAVASERRAGF